MKNKKNLTSDQRSEPAANQVNGDYDGSEPEEDPFFDDPLPKSDRSDKQASKNRLEIYLSDAECHNFQKCRTRFFLQ